MARKFSMATMAQCYRQFSDFKACLNVLLGKDERQGLHRFEHVNFLISS